MKAYLVKGLVSVMFVKPMAPHAERFLVLCLNSSWTEDTRSCIFSDTSLHPGKDGQKPLAAELDKQIEQKFKEFEELVTKGKNLLDKDHHLTQMVSIVLLYLYGGFCCRVTPSFCRSKSAWRSCGVCSGGSLCTGGLRNNSGFTRRAEKKLHKITFTPQCAQ